MRQPVYFKRHGTPRPPAELTKHNCLIDKADRYSERWRFTKGTEKINVPVAANLIPPSAATLKAAALSGLGVMAVQKWMAAAATKEGQPAAVLADYDVSPTDYDTALYAVYPHRRGLSPKSRAFVDFLVGLFRRQA
jgi:DNA-binding transcriptional LysR family regulator